MRLGLAELLSRHTDIDVVGHAKDGLMAVELVRQIHPQVIVMDVNMPGMDGIEATSIITQEFADIRVVGISMHDEPEVRDAMLSAGARTFLAKDGPPEGLVAAIRGISW